MIAAVSMLHSVEALAKEPEAQLRWFDRSFGAGVAPDRLYATGEYGWKGSPASITGYGAVTGTLVHASATVYWDPGEFLQLSAYTGRSQYYHLFAGGGWTQVATADPMRFSRTRLLDENRGRAAGIWVGGVQAKFYWSTFRLLPATLEGVVSVARRFQWLDSSVAGSVFYDPVAAALVGRNERFWDFFFFGGWRANPEAKNATRIGAMIQLSWFETNHVRQVRVGPALQTRAQGSLWEWYVQMPVRIVDPYDDRDVGILVNLSYKGL